jgi:adenylate cyclase
LDACAAGKIEEALSVALTVVEIDANSFLAQRLAGLCYMTLQHYDKAIETFHHLLTISNRHQHAVNSLIWTCCRSGKTEEAKVLMQELEQRSASKYISGRYRGLLAAYLGNLDAALGFLH